MCAHPLQPLLIPHGPNNMLHGAAGTYRASMTTCGWLKMGLRCRATMAPSSGTPPSRCRCVHMCCCWHEQCVHTLPCLPTHSSPCKPLLSYRSLRKSFALYLLAQQPISSLPWLLRSVHKRFGWAADTLYALPSDRALAAACALTAGFVIAAVRKQCSCMRPCF